MDTTFYNAHKPVLNDGEYTIEVEHSIGLMDYTETDTDKQRKSQIISSSVMFTVNGPRFNLSPTDIHSQFPLAGAKGDFESFLPYVVFNRSTLPWERTPFNGYNGSASWLFLLVVDEDDVMNKNVIEFNLKYSDIDDSKHAVLGIDEATASDEKKLIDQNISINLITINEDSITSYIPNSLDNIGLLSYVRIKYNEEQAVIVANRLPSLGKNSIVYLISLENKFDASSKLLNSSFIYLKKWKFHTEIEQLFSFSNGNYEKAIQKDPLLKNTLNATCANDVSVEHNFQDFINSAVQNPKSLSDDQKKVLRHSCKLPGTTFHEILSNLKGGTNYLKDTNNTISIAQTGTTTLPWQHKDEQGFVVYDYANYRGPLVAKPLNLNSAIFNKKESLHPSKRSLLPIFVDHNGFIPVDADELKITYQTRVDCTYAAAYELGKLTALNDNAFASAFFKWKINYANKQLNAKNDNTQHLAASNVIVAPELPLKLQSKFNDWKLLKGLPFRYYVPEPVFFPHESLRIFQIDNNWINAFICGAFSIGYTPKSAGLEQELIKLFISDINYGFLLNSIAIKAWPDYELEATVGGEPMNLNSDFSMNLKRKDNLNGSTHIYIFDKQFDSLKFHLHPAKLLPGFMVEDKQFWKNGNQLNDNPIDPVTRVIKLDNLKTLAPTATASSFNAWLMEGTPEVVFNFI